MKLIEKLPSGSTSMDGIWWTRHPTQGDIAEKVDEIIDVVNNFITTNNLRPKGEWKKVSGYKIICTNCKEEPVYANLEGYILTKSCPNCGADMRKDELNE